MDSVPLIDFLPLLTAVCSTLRGSGTFPSPLFGTSEVFSSGFLTASGDLGLAPGDLGFAPGDLGRAPGDLGRAPGDLGRAPGDLGRAPGDLGRAPGDLGRAPGDFGLAAGSDFLMSGISLGLCLGLSKESGFKEGAGAGSAGFSGEG